MGLSRERLSMEEEIVANRKSHNGLSCESSIPVKVLNKDSWPIPDSRNPVESDPVNHPPHYNNSEAKCECGRRISCIDVTRHLSFNIGNAMKYLWRCELKGNTLEDLKKAAWYIQDEIAKREKSI